MPLGVVTTRVPSGRRTNVQPRAWASSRHRLRPQHAEGPVVTGGLGGAGERVGGGPAGVRASTARPTTRSAQPGASASGRTAASTAISTAGSACVDRATSATIARPRSTSSSPSASAAQVPGSNRTSVCACTQA